MLTNMITFLCVCVCHYIVESIIGLPGQQEYSIERYLYLVLLSKLVNFNTLFSSFTLFIYKTVPVY